MARALLLAFLLRIASVRASFDGLPDKTSAPHPCQDPETIFREFSLLLQAPADPAGIP